MELRLAWNQVYVLQGNASCVMAYLSYYDIGASFRVASNLRVTSLLG